MIEIFKANVEKLVGQKGSITEKWKKYFKIVHLKDDNNNRTPFFRTAFRK